MPSPATTDRGSFHVALQSALIGIQAAKFLIRDKAREYTVEALETLAAVMRDKRAPAAARVSAANALLDRGYGKPLQTVEGELGGAVPADIVVRFVRPGEIE